MLPARSPPVRGQQWTLQPASPPSPLPVQHTPSRERRPFTSNPAVALTGEGDIPTSSHSFLLLWKIKVKTSSDQRPQHLPRTCFSCVWRKEGREGTERRRCSLNFPQFMNNFSIFFCCFVLTKGMRLTEVYVFFPLFDKEPILKPMNSCPGLLSPQE